MNADSPQREPPDLEQRFSERARFLYSARRYDEVLELVAAHWKECPDCPAGFEWAAYVAANRGQFGKAVEAAEKRIASDPQSGAAFNSLALVLLHAVDAKVRGVWERALEAARTARDLEPSHAGFRATAARAFAAAGDFLSAEQEARASLELDPGSVEAHVMLVAALNGQHRFRDALAVSRAAPAAALSSPWMHFRRGAALAGLGRSYQAAESFAEALRLAPYWKGARVEAMRALIERSRLWKFACTLREQQSSVAMRLVFPASMGVVLWFFALSVAGMAGARGDGVLAATGAIGVFGAWCVRLGGADPEGLFVLTRRRSDLARTLATEGERRGATALVFRFAALAAGTAHAAVDGPVALLAHFAADFVAYGPAARAFVDARIGRRGFAALLVVAAAAATAAAAAHLRRGG